MHRWVRIAGLGDTCFMVLSCRSLAELWPPGFWRLVFASNRNNTVRGETNVFIADWR
jgi:hypothetical protein